MNHQGPHARLLVEVLDALSVIGADADLASSVIDGKVDALAGLEAKVVEIAIGHDHPRKGRFAVVTGLVLQGDALDGRPDIRADACFRMGVSHSQFLA